MKKSLTLTLVAITYFANISVVAANQVDVLAGVASVIGALNGNPVYVHPGIVPQGNLTRVGPHTLFRPTPPQNGGINACPNNNQSPNYNPFVPQPSPYSNRSLDGNWNSNRGQAVIVQSGRRVKLLLGNHVFVGFRNGDQLSVRHTATGDLYNGVVAPDGNTIQFPNVTFTRTPVGPQPPSPQPNPQPYPGPNPGPNPRPWVGGMRHVTIGAIRCVDLQNDRVIDRLKQDNVELRIYADGQLVDTVRTRFTMAGEGRTKRLDRSYSYSRSLEVKLYVGGNEIPGNMLLTMGSPTGHQQSSFAVGIDQRFEWTQYDVLANVR